MFIVNGHFYIDISTEGGSLPLPPGTFDYILIIQNVMQMVPTLTIELKDTSHIFMKDFPLVEGTPLTVKMGNTKEKEPPIEMRFRVISMPKMASHGSGSNQRIKAILDCDSLFAIPQKVYKGTSSQVITEIGKEAGLTVEADPSNDSMTWLSLGQKCGMFMHDVCSHAWADNKSLFALGITDTFKLRFKNLSLLKKEKAKSLLYYSEKPPQSQVGNPIQVLNYNFSSLNGYRNLVFNYGMSAIKEKLDGAFEEFKTLDIDKTASFLEMSKRVKGVVGLAQQFLGDLDLENAHKEFQRAEYQNKRGAATYGTTANILTAVPSALELLDLVNLYTPRSGGSSNEMFNGDYIVTGKTRLITGNVYSEKIALVTQGRNLDPKGNLL